MIPLDYIDTAFRYILGSGSKKEETTSFRVTHTELGSGGYGQVFLGFRNDQEIAVKKLRQNSYLIERELYALRSVQAHKNVIEFLGVKRDNDFTYIALELGEMELYDMVCKDGMPEQDAKPIFQQMVEAVQFIHSRRVVHRDIKLENWMMKNQTPKLIDFGLAHVYREGDSPILTSCVGSKSYCCPNVFKGRYNGFSCDVWSIIVCLFAMISGFFPYECASTYDWRFTKIFQRSNCAPKDIYGLYSMTCPFSDDLCDLIHNVIGVSHIFRLSIEDIATHVWIKQHKAAAEQEVDVETTMWRSTPSNNTPFLTRMERFMLPDAAKK